MSFKDKTVVITGATSGVGADVANYLASQGAKVVIGGRREERGAQVAAASDNISFVKLDVLSEESSAAFFKAASERLGGAFDLVFLNAGVEGPTGPAGELSKFASNDFDFVFGVNVRGVAVGLRDALPLVKPTGAVFVTSSVVALVPVPSAPIYAASKAAVDSLIDAYAAQIAAAKQTVSLFGLNLCAFESEMLQRFTGGQTQAAAGFNPSGTIGKGSQIGEAIDSIVHEKTEFKSGAHIAVDAGPILFPASEYTTRLQQASKK